VIIAFFTRVLFAAYFLEAGFILIVAPWSGFWDRNFFAASAPALRPWLESPFVRGAVSGIGGITAIAGLAELGGLLARRRSGQTAAPEQPTDSGRWHPDH
jgi:hypothetical protein